MIEDDPVEIVDDFLDRHVDAIATHLLYLGVQRAMRRAKDRKHPEFVIIDSISPLTGPTHDFPGMGAKIKALMEVAKKSNIAIVTARQVSSTDYGN
jgi:predicted ATP-dependent serine protease